MKQKNYSIIFVHRNLANCKSEIYHFNCEYWRNGLHTRVFSSATHAISHDGNIATHPSTSRTNTSNEVIVCSLHMFLPLYEFQIDECCRAILNSMLYTIKTLCAASNFIAIIDFHSARLATHRIYPCRQQPLVVRV